MYRTTASYLSGGICGHMWWPQAMAGKTQQADLRPIINRFSDSRQVTFREMLDSILMSDGGDFQNALFTADTVIRIERRYVHSPGKYSVHVKEIPVADILPDLVNNEYDTCDFFGEE